MFFLHAWNVIGSPYTEVQYDYDFKVADQIHMYYERTAEIRSSYCKCSFRVRQGFGHVQILIIAIHGEESGMRGDGVMGLDGARWGLMGVDGG